MSARKARILVVDDEEGIRKTLRVCLESARYQVDVASGSTEALASVRKAAPDAILMDVRLGGLDGIGLTRQLRADGVVAPVIVMTAYASIDAAVDAMKAGATEFLPKPFTPAHVLHVVGKVLDDARLRVELSELRTSGRRVQAWFASKHPAYQDMLALLARVAGTDATVLLLGETGTGKGVLARHVHALSPRAERPFVTFNCAVVSSTLIENELFGHARGAYTGADAAQPGHVEVAANGTLFLDEVGDLPREAQGKLLRLLEEREYTRVGDVTARHSDVRVIAATRGDLRAAVAEGKFRDDLFYRLNVVTVRVPPLRERAEDLEPLALTVLSDLCVQHGRAAMTLAPETMAALRVHTWPGNVRELVNVLERAVILAHGTVFTPDLLPSELVPAPRTEAGTDDESLEAAERRHIAAVLARHPTLDAASRALGIDASTLYRKRERYGLR